MVRSNEYDGVRISDKLTNLCIQSMISVAESHNIEFMDLDLGGKRDFMKIYGKEVMDICIAQPGGEVFEDKVVLWVENKGCAGLIFTKKNHNVRR